jgi:hypothetical protein
VHVDPDVVIAGQGALAGVQADGCVLRALWTATAAPTAFLALGKTTKNASPCVLTSQPPASSKIARSRRW